ncbi:MAG TPA: HAMP domain-containing sensor histidine kinase [Bacteroidales bacterium]|nr:HAMP domain-containing sensor histidine kinase [Bacteroidales bacterium]HPI86115.1 HAMP domain-containing sensor histidine kinase [Bacteroidales bacterium]
MQIRARLTLQFITIVALTLLLAALAIYYFSEGHRKEDFFDRLNKKASNTAMLLIQFDEVDINLLKKMEADNPVSLPREKIIIYDYKDNIIYSTDEVSLFTIDKALLDNIRLNEEVRLKQGEYEILGFLFTHQYDRFVVIAGAVDIYGLKRMHNLRNILIIVVSISILLMLVSGWIYAGRALYPISRIISKGNEISITSLNLRLDEGNQKDEIAQLAGTFNKMLDRLETAFKSQKRFIANASHELRTPLTAITGQLEVLLMQDRTTEEYKRAVNSVLEDMKNLNSISNRLLLLAQASNDLSELNVKPIRIDETIWQCREELIRRNENNHIIVHLDNSLEDDAALTFMGDEQLVRTMIINLMDNGCKYSPDHTVEVTIGADQLQLLLTFTDRGIGIPEEDLAHVFEPFRRGQNAYPVKGHGIGLSLVERIVILHNGSIEVDSQPGEGTTFRVFLPQKTDPEFLTTF